MYNLLLKQRNCIYSCSNFFKNRHLLSRLLRARTIGYYREEYIFQSKYSISVKFFFKNFTRIVSYVWKWNLENLRFEILSGIIASVLQHVCIKIWKIILIKGNDIEQLHLRVYFV